MQPIPVYLRRKIVRAYHNGGSAADVAYRFGISSQSVRNYVRLDEEGDLAPKPRSGGPKTALNDDDRRRLRETVDAHPDATLEELIEMCGFDVSDSTLSRELTKIDRPRKRKVPRASEQSEERTQQKRQEWSKRTEDIDPKRLVFIDEMGITTKMTRLYARAPANVRVYTDVPHRHYQSLTVLGGMRLGGAGNLPVMVYPGGTTTERMLEYVTGTLADVLEKGSIVVADNLASHKANRVREAVEEQDAEIWFLPPYSPDLNPIERMWSKAKTWLRKTKAKTEEVLRKAASEAIATVTNSDIRNWFDHADYMPEAI